MTDQTQAVEEIELKFEDAQVTTFNGVNIYRWESTISAGFATWWVNVKKPVVGGGIHVSGWNQVYMTDTYPMDATTWKLGSYNAGLGKVSVSLYVISLV